MVWLTRFWNCNRINEDLRAFWVNRILLLSNGAYFHPPMHFQEVFSRYHWNGPSTLKIEENKLHFFSIFGLDGSSPNSLGPPGILWDPLGPPGGVPQGPRGGIKVGKLLGIMVTGGCFPYVIYEQPLRGEQVLQCNDLWSHRGGLPLPLTGASTDTPQIRLERTHR